MDIDKIRVEMWKNNLSYRKFTRFFTILDLKFDFLTFSHQFLTYHIIFKFLSFLTYFSHLTQTLNFSHFPHISLSGPSLPIAHSFPFQAKSKKLTLISHPRSSNATRLSSLSPVHSPSLRKKNHLFKFQIIQNMQLWKIFFRFI
jgi:hypothetical protein